MREYKFRGKANNEWYYGDLIIANNTDKSKHYYIIANEYSDEDGNIPNTIKLDTCNSPEIDKETIGQYTGLKDKNGKEIYSGDIVKLNDEGRKLFGTNKYLSAEFQVVGFCDGAYMTGRNQGFPHNYNTYLWVIRDYIEVVSTVYDNPELLKEDKQY